MARIDERSVRTWFDLIHENGDCIEVRVLDGKRSSSGYYRDIEKAVEAIASVTSGGIYSPINAIKQDCYSRTQSDQLVLSPKATTNDGDIEGRRWILIDLDPKRASDTNATDEEKAFAKQMMVKVGSYLRDQGFESPIVADSGNGYHLYYRVNLANNEDTLTLVKEFLQVIDMLFSNDHVDIDTSVFNASRIAKVIGTVSRKGTDTEERPQRMSCFVKIPSEVRPTDIAYIRKVAAMLPKREAPSRSNNFNERFDLDKFFHDHNIEVERTARFKDGIKYILHHCPFDDNHKAPDAAVFQMNDGSYGFKCLHNSCSGRTWRDFRLFYDPHAYDRKAYNEFVSRIRYERPQLSMPKPETEELGKKWLTMSDIKYVDPSKVMTIPTGFTSLDRRIGGLMAGDVTVLSGLSGAGKTSWLDSVLLNAIDKGFKCAVWSGELQDFRFQSWIDQIAAGKGHVVKNEGYENVWYAPKRIADKINAWLGDSLHLYNNEYGSKWSQIFADLDTVVEAGAQLIVLDNLAALDIESETSNEFLQQKKFINDIKEYAKKHNIHIIAVIHPRKEMQFLRKESISGTADLTNLAANVLIIHRVGADFETRAGQFFGKAKVQEFAGFDCVIEVAKNRAYGVVDYLCGMYYEKESRRLKNDVAENRIYGWREDGEQMSIQMPIDPYRPLQPKPEEWDIPAPMIIPDEQMPF